MITKKSIRISESSQEAVSDFSEKSDRQIRAVSRRIAQIGNEFGAFSDWYSSSLEEILRRNFGAERTFFRVESRRGRRISSFVRARHLRQSKEWGICRYGQRLFGKRRHRRIVRNAATFSEIFSAPRRQETLWSHCFKKRIERTTNTGGSPQLGSCADIRRRLSLKVEEDIRAEELS